jgi:hypothetical protein
MPRPRSLAVRQSFVMRHRILWRMLGLGVLAAGAYAVWRAIDDGRSLDDAGWEAQPFPFPPQPLVVTADPTWVEPETAACPVSHPVKAKLSSGIFHVPGAASYGRTLPDRCYRDAGAAEADGLRRARR